MAFVGRTPFEGDAETIVKHVVSTTHPYNPNLTGYDTRDGDLEGEYAIQVRKVTSEKDAIFDAMGNYQGSTQDLQFQKDVNPWADFNGWNTAKAVGWTLLDVASFGVFDGLEKRKLDAWKDSGLADTIVPDLVEGGLTIAREVGFTWATAGVGGLTAVTRVGLLARKGFLTAVAARSVVDGITSSVDAYYDFKAGNYGAGTINAIAAVGSAFGIGALGSIKYPAPRIPLYWHTSKEAFEAVMRNGRFISGTGNGTKFWATSRGQGGKWTELLIGGKRNVDSLIPFRTSIKGDFSHPYRLTAEEASHFRPATGFSIRGTLFNGTKELSLVNTTSILELLAGANGVPN